MNRLTILCPLIFACLAAAEPRVPVRVELGGRPGEWQLLRAGKPYFIQGGGGKGSQKALVVAGAAVANIPLHVKGAGTSQK